MEMSTMERLFLEIFDRKSRIERQLHQQAESYGQSVACNIVAQGGRPPPWLCETGLGTYVFPDLGGLNKEQLVSGIFFPNPLANTSLEDPRTYFIIPDTNYGNICKPNNLFCEMSALDKSLHIELINKEATETSEHNHSTMLESKAVDVCSEIDELDWVPTSISSQRDLESYVCKKAKTSNPEGQCGTNNQKIGRTTRSGPVSKKSGCIKNLTAANKHADLQNRGGGRVTRSRSRLTAEEFNSSGKSLGANSFYQVKDLEHQPTECQSDVHPLQLAELNNSRSDTINNVTIAHMYANDDTANKIITGKMQSAMSSTSCDAKCLVEPKTLSLDGIHSGQVNENSLCEFYKENQLHSCENALSRPEAMQPIQENSTSRQTMGMHVSPNEKVQQEDRFHDAEDISGIERVDRQSNGGINEDREEFLFTKASEYHLQYQPCFISPALYPTCVNAFGSCESFHGHLDSSGVITRESSSGISVKRSGEQLSRKLKTTSKNDAALWQGEGMASETHLQIDKLKESDCRKKSFPGLDKGSKCTCSCDVSRKKNALQSHIERSLCGACVSLVDMQLLKGDIVTTVANLTGNDAYTAPIERQGGRQEISEVADSAYNIEPASNGYKPSDTPPVSSSRLESESCKHAPSSQVSDFSTLISPLTYSENDCAKTPGPACMDIILPPDECSVGITEDDISGSCRVNVSVLPLSPKDSTSLSAYKIVDGTNFLVEVKDPAIEKISRSSENNNNSSQGRYFLRSSSFVNNATLMKSNASVLSCSDGDSMLLEADKVEIGHCNVEKSMTKKGLASGYGERHSMASEDRYFLRSSTIHNRNLSPHKSDGAYCVNELKKVEATNHENEYSWPKKRNMKHKSSNIFATSPRSRARSFLETKQHNRCKHKTGNNSETAMLLQSASKLINIRMPTAAPSESQQNDKSHLLEHGSDLNSNNSYLVIPSFEVIQNKTPHIVEENFSVCSRDEVMTTNLMTFESEIHHTSGGAEKCWPNVFMQHGSDLNLNNSYLVIPSFEVIQNKTPHIVEENFGVCSRDEVMTTNLMTFESEIHHTSGGAENVPSFMDAFPKEASKDLGHHDGSDEGEKTFNALQNMYKCDMAGMSNIDGDKANYNESMPEFERFTMDFPYRLEDNIVYKDFDIPIHAKEEASILDQAFVLEQLHMPRIIRTSRSEPSMMNGLDDISDGFQLSPLGILENMDLGFSLDQDKASVEHIGASSSHKLMDFCYNFGSQSGGPAPERSHSQPSLSARLGSEYRNPPLTPPVRKLSYDRLSGKRNSSSLKMSSESELVCFRIDENSSTTEENADIIQVDHATHLASSRKIEVSTTSKALSDVTAVYQNGTGSISNSREFVLRDSLESVNSQAGSSSGFGCAGNGELENKENSMCSDVINRHQKAAEAHSNMSEKSKSFCKSRERSGNYKNTKEGCKPSNILSNISSFVPHIRQKQQGALPLFGKKDVKIKALEVAEAAKRLEEKKQIEREMRKAAAAAAKLEREKLEQENAKQLELKQKLKEEERKKKEASVAARKRHREEEERKAKERKRRCIEETRTLQREHEDKLRQEKGRGFQEKATKQKGRKQVANFKGQQKLEKERNLNGDQIAPRVQHCTIQSASCTTESADYIVQVQEASNENTYIAKGASSSDVIPEVIEEISPTRIFQDLQPYEMSPFHSDDEEVEDDSWRKKKYIPLWARRESLGRIVLSTQHIDPKQIFCRKRSFNIPEVLPTGAPWRPLL